MFVIEGADHLGKTTVAKRIVSMAAEDGIFPIRYAHMTRPNSAFDFGGDYKDMISKYAVQDRFHLGGHVWHPEGTVTDAWMDQIAWWLNSVASVTLVMFTSNESWYRKRLVENGKDEMFSRETIIGANRKFAGLAGQYHGTAHCDFTIDVMDGEYPTDVTIRRLLNEWYTRLHECPSTKRSRCYTGPLR